MKKSISLMLILILTVFTLTACKDPMAKYQNLPDEYVEGTDFMNGFNRSENLRQIVTKGEGGYYIYHRCFIYFYDTESKMLVPLCNRPDCLHDKNPDEYTTWSCDAYLPGADNFMQFYEGYLYATCDMFSVDGELMLAGKTYLLKIAPDRSSVEALTPIDLPHSSSAFIHRGYLYAFPRSSNDGETLQITRYSLMDPQADPVVLLELPADDFIVSAYPLGNHIYFTHGTTNETLCALNIQTLESRELKTVFSSADSYSTLWLCGVYQNELILLPQSYEEGVGYIYTDAYLYDPKSETAEPVFDLRPYSASGFKRLSLLSDGTNPILYEAVDNESLTISPLNEDFALRGDSCTLPFSASFSSNFYPCDGSFSLFSHNHIDLYAIDRNAPIKSTVLLDENKTLIHTFFTYAPEDFASNAIYNPLA